MPTTASIFKFNAIIEDFNLKQLQHLKYSNGH